MLQTAEELLNKRRFFAILQIFEEVLKHSAGSTGCGYKLKNRVVLMQILLPRSQISCRVVDFQNAIAYRGSSGNVKGRKTGFKRVKLSFCLLGRDTALSELLEVFFGKHI